ncbi:MAG: LysM peptidoglycan-binding domain-containing protein [Lachnospiraceae bacterium]|nr:LysM peptidoglycan-binding domain-containing protein [Lachnospiraceae bacterium]
MQDAINDINGMNNSLFEDMKNWAYETTGEVWEVVEAWKEAKEALEMYNAVNKVPEIHENLHNNSQNGVATAIGATSSMGGKTLSNSTSSANSNSQINSNNSSGYKAVHNIVKNDTLWTLAQKYYGDGTKWTKIQKANSDVDPYKLQIGKKLYIPYRKGIKKVPQNQLALTDEAGDELTLHANEKGNLQMLTKGSSVIPADITENLVKWGKVAPDLFMQNLQPFISPMIIHEFTPKEASPTVNIGDININGNIGSLTKSDLNEFRKDIVNDVYDSMQKNRVKSGRY